MLLMQFRHSKRKIMNSKLFLFYNVVGIIVRILFRRKVLNTNVHIVIFVFNDMLCDYNYVTN